MLLKLIYGSIAVVSAAWATEKLHAGLALDWAPAYLVAINLVAFVFYAFDKSFADVLEFFKVRVPEVILVWGLAFPCGWIGALVGMLTADHKTGPGTTAFRKKLINAYVVFVILFLLVQALAKQALVSLELVDGVVSQLVTLVMQVARAMMQVAGTLVESVEALRQ